jgi:hypothetical protein
MVNAAGHLLSVCCAVENVVAFVPKLYRALLLGAAKLYVVHDVA